MRKCYGLIHGVSRKTVFDNKGRWLRCADFFKDCIDRDDGRRLGIDRGRNIAKLWGTFGGRRKIERRGYVVFADIVLDNSPDGWIVEFT